VARANKIILGISILEMWNPCLVLTFPLVHLMVVDIESAQLFIL